MKPIALIVDDEADLCMLMQMTLTKMGMDSHVAYSLEMAYEFFDNHRYDFCLTDLALPDGSGLELVKKVVESGENTPIAVITAHGSQDLAIEALKLGAFDFVNKPLKVDRLRQLVSHALKAASSTTVTSQDAPAIISPEEKLFSERLIGTSAPMDSLRSTIKKLARSQAPVFLSGASGTGKEVVAKLIHDLSPRREGSFVPVNCGAIPSELMESEFFGHKKGSFTGATTDKIGLFQQANGGTLFLDEVADLPLAMQVKLLRAIQEKTVRAIGDTKEVPVDIRILSATHKDLSKLVQMGAFRQDLFYRINVIMVKLPTLNERKEDIGLLANHFLSLIAKEWEIDTPVLSADAMAQLKEHDFEGNVRELRNLLERAVTMSEDNVIESVHLFGANQKIDRPSDSSPYQDNRQSYQASVTPINPISKTGVKVAINYGGANSLPLSSVKPLIEEDIELFKDEDTIAITPKQDSDDIVVLTPEGVNPQELTLPKEGLEAYLQNQEKMLIAAALVQAGNNKTQAAKLLGMSFRSLRYRMKKLELEEGDD